MSIELVLSIHRATHRIALLLGQGRRLGRRRSGLGVNQAEAHVLAFLRESGSASTAAIHGAFGHRRSTLTSILDRLEERKLVEREVRREDRRSFNVKLTNKGRRLAERVHARLAEIEQELLVGLTQKERESARAFLKAVGTPRVNK